MKKPTNRELDALKDIAGWKGAYRWKPASMAKLHARGFVEPMRAGWRITKAGRDHLSALATADAPDPTQTGWEAPPAGEREVECG